MAHAEGASGARFPALDPEPPARSSVFRAGVGGLAIAVAALCALSGWALSARESHSVSTGLLPTAARSGRILSVTGLGSLYDSRPEGADLRKLSGSGLLDIRGVPWESPGGGFLAFSNGVIVATGSGRPVVVKDRLSLAADQVLSDAPFSAGESDVVVLTEGRYGNQTTSAGVSVENLDSGVSTTLGTGSYAAGDPHTPGAFVAVPSLSPAVGAIRNPSIPDSELDLVDAGRAPVVLASAASLTHDLGMEPDTPVSLLPVPSPSGSLIVVVVESLLDAPGSNAGFVVLDRSGKTVAVQTSGAGPVTGSLPRWSPDGSDVAYASGGRAGNVISVWTVGGGLFTTPLKAGSGSAQCLWSPSGAALLCDSPHLVNGRESNTWVFTAPGGGPVASVSGPGFAVDWYRG